MPLSEVLSSKEFNGQLPSSLENGGSNYEITADARGNDGTSDELGVVATANTCSQHIRCLYCRNVPTGANTELSPTPPQGSRDSGVLSSVKKQGRLFGPCHKWHLPMAFPHPTWAATDPHSPVGADVFNP